MERDKRCSAEDWLASLKGGLEQLHIGDYKSQELSKMFSKEDAATVKAKFLSLFCGIEAITKMMEENEESEDLHSFFTFFTFFTLFIL